MRQQESFTLVCVSEHVQICITGYINFLRRIFIQMMKLQLESSKLITKRGIFIGQLFPLTRDPNFTFYC